MKKSENSAVTAYIELKITPQRSNGFDRIAKRICQHPEVTSLHLMSGGYDIGLIVEGKTLNDVAAFVSQHLAPMDAVISTATHFVLKRYKENGKILEGDTKDTREVISL